MPIKKIEDVGDAEAPLYELIEDMKEALDTLYKETPLCRQVWGWRGLGPVAK